MADFKQYRRSSIAELRPYVPGEEATLVESKVNPGHFMDPFTISAEDRAAGSPKEGDMIARNPKNHADQWLVAGQYFADNFEEVA